MGKKRPANIEIFSVGLSPNGMWYINRPDMGQGGTPGYGTTYCKDLNTIADMIGSFPKHPLYENTMSRCRKIFEGLTHDC